jgi:hypothetical protein
MAVEAANAQDGRLAVADQGVMSGRPKCCFLLVFDVRARPSSVIMRLTQKVPGAASLKALGAGYLTYSTSQDTGNAGSVSGCRFKRFSPAIV